MSDPYIYPGTNVLKNLRDIRDKATLAAFERQWSLLRLTEPFPLMRMTATGYRKLHQHIFQDIYHWAGKFRTVDIAKGGHQFARPQFIESEMEKRFTLIRSTADDMRGTRISFAKEAARHLAELNAIIHFARAMAGPTGFF